jgi:hypothetical protein
MKCSICGFEIKDFDVCIGTGDGTGKSFAHEACYYRNEAERYKKLFREYKEHLNSKLKDLCDMGA